MSFSILIPARGGSKRIPNKNIVDLCGKPLIYYAIKESLMITKNVFVSTDSAEIKEVSKQHGAFVIDRPNHLSNDTSTTNSVISHFLQDRNIEYFACVQPTSPLLKSKYILHGIEKIKHMGHDSVISVYKDKQFCWNKEGVPINFNLGRKPRTQDMPEWYVENGAFYITSKKNFLKEDKLVRGKVGFVEMSKMDSIDIDEYQDLEIARVFMKYRCDTPPEELKNEF
jgi:CMP-N-acetylneuraminic acid synthetase